MTKNERKKTQKQKQEIVDAIGGHGGPRNLTLPRAPQQAKPA